MSKKGMRASYVLAMLAKVDIRPRIFRTYYPKSKRSYWRVSPTPVPWSKLTITQQMRWNAAYKFREQLNAKRAICDHCGKEL